MPDDPPYDPLLVRDYIICRSGGTLDRLQVIKIADIAYGWVLGLTGTRLFTGGIEAWAYGPVVPAIYESLKGYGGTIENLPYPIRDADGGLAGHLRSIEGRMTPEITGIIGPVVDRYRHLGGTELLRLTHVKGTPWERAYRRGGQHVPIPDGLIKQYYHGMVAEARSG